MREVSRPIEQNPMVKSLLGDLTLRDPHPSSSGFAATALLDTMTGDAHERSLPTDRHLHDLFVTGSPVQAMRSHFTAMRDDQATGTRLLTFHDPLQQIAPAVLKMLSESGGQPIERLHLRDQSTLATLAMVGRATVSRRSDDMLRIYSADIAGGTSQAHDIPIALMERSDMACVVLGALPLTAVDDLLSALTVASFALTWRCTSLLFLLPTDSGAAVAEKIRNITWPRALRVHSVYDPLTSPTSVWNVLSASLSLIKPGAVASAPPPAPVMPSPPSTVPAIPPTARRTGPGYRAIDPVEAGQMLRELMHLDGMLYVTVVDSDTGVPVAAEGQGTDFVQAATAATEILRMHRRTLRMTGHPRPLDAVDEIVVAVGGRYHLLRTLTAFPEHFIFAVLDKLRSNLATARFRLLEAQQTLG